MSSTTSRRALPDSGAAERKPEINALVSIRGKRWIVGDVVEAARSTLVTLQSVEDGEYGRTLDVIWEVEPRRQVLPSGALPTVTEGGFDPPERLAAFTSSPRSGAAPGEAPTWSPTSCCAPTTCSTAVARPG